MCYGALLPLQPEISKLKTTLLELAEHRNKGRHDQLNHTDTLGTPAQLLLAWARQRSGGSVVMSVGEIALLEDPGTELIAPSTSGKAERMVECASAEKILLRDEELRAIDIAGEERDNVTWMTIAKLGRDEKGSQ
jgi:hypothetical protein